MDISPMDLSPGTMIAHLLVGSVGFAIFMYGKKQKRAPQLGAGVVLMVMPYAATGLAIWLASAGLLLGLWLAVRAGF